MGGFEGGDEAGFWDNGRFEHCKADVSKKEKTEPLLQIEGKVFKVLFVENDSEKGIAFKDDAITYSVYKAMLDYTLEDDLADFFHTHKVILQETPELVPKHQQFLCNEMILLRLIKDACSLVLTCDELDHIKKNIFKASPESL